MESSPLGLCCMWWEPPAVQTYYNLFGKFSQELAGWLIGNFDLFEQIRFATLWLWLLCFRLINGAFGSLVAFINRFMRLLNRLVPLVNRSMASINRKSLWWSFVRLFALGELFLVRVWEWLSWGETPTNAGVVHKKTKGPERHKPNLYKT